MKKLLGELLIERGLLTEERLEVALKHQRVTGELIGDILIRLGFVSSMDVAQCLAEQAGMEFIDINTYPVSEDALKMIPKSISERFEFLPIDRKDGRLIIGVRNPGNVSAIDSVMRFTGQTPQVVIVDQEIFRDVLESSYYFVENPVETKILSMIDAMRSTETVPVQSVSQMVDLLITDGIRRRATDIHISSSYDSVDIFYRVDGILQHGYCIPKIAQAPMVSRIKVLARLDITEQRLPHDGSFIFQFLDKTLEMRVSVVPTIYGENVVIRILGFSGTLLRLDNLGFSRDNVDKLKTLFSKPHGIILVCGPTGSGKTTTIYAAMREIDLLKRNVLSVEDPVEYRMSFVRQVQVNEKIGLDFVLVGRNFMRHDPDVIFLGEIRDEETARIAVRASITGHLVLSTLHTNDAITAIPRLLDLGADRSLLSSSILGIVAQRLLRRLCPKCKERYRASAEEIHILGDNGHMDIYRSKGCKYCHNTGYLGRIAIGEIIIFDDELRDMVAQGASLVSLKESARRKGAVFMVEDGIKKVLEGITSIYELRRVMGL